MNEKFFALSQEKQTAIRNAAMEVFAKNEYKRASTDLIAAKAGISKGLLFYYFHNKKELYLYLYDYVMEIMRKSASEGRLADITDFFELLHHAAVIKVKIMEKNPFIAEFAMKAYYSCKEDISDDVKQLNASQQRTAYEMYMMNVDKTKFRDGVDIYELYQVLIWTTTGYLYEMQMLGEKLDVDSVMKEFEKWSQMFKKMTYKEEYQGGND